MDSLLTWLFLNSRQPRDDQAMSALGNSSTLTPATAAVKDITDIAEDILTILADSDNNESAIKIAL
jgi:multisubunit Na+/H+ antiporter MnhE subunit